MQRRGAIRAALAALLATFLAGTAAAKPARIVSTHLCGDQLLLLLAERDRIAALSYFAADPHLSELAALAKGLPRTRGVVEEILPLAPDIVFAGAFSARPTVHLLRRLGRKVIELPAATDFDGIRGNIRSVAREIGESARGEALIEGFDGRLARLGQPMATSAPVAALYWSKGYTPASASLAAAAARRAGFVDLGAALGYAGAARVSLETLLRADPDLVVTASRGPAALADLPLRHPALVRAFGAERRLAMPDRLWICGAPFVVDAILRLRATHPAPVR